MRSRPDGADRDAAPGRTLEPERLTGHPAAVVDLDELYLMMAAKPMGDPQTWDRARRAAAALADCFFSSGIQVVVVEGAFCDEPERGPFLSALTWTGSPLFVTLLVSFEVAYRRVQGDSGRTYPRSPGLLKRNNQEFAARLGPVRTTDLVLDSDVQTPQQLVTAILNSGALTA